MIEESKYHKQGSLFAFIAFFIWGIFPLYWQLLLHVPLEDVLALRIIYLAVLMQLFLFWQKQSSGLLIILHNPRIFIQVLASTAMIGINWYIFMYIVMTGKTIQASLGYFINPLINILLGIVFFKERLTSIQIIAAFCALVGVLPYLFNHENLPIYAFLLALSFAFYSLIRKSSPLNASLGLAAESSLLSVAILVYFMLNNFSDKLVQLSQYDFNTHLFLIGGGIVTAIPLLLFIKAAQRIRLSSLGYFQYIAPTCQFVIAVFIFGEELNSKLVFCFIMTWIGLALIVSEQFLKNWRKKAAH